MEKFEDVAMGIAFGKISKTVDGGETSEIYITKDGGNSFNKLEIINSDIYDCYSLPTFENGILSIKITQGSDGDYNGGDYKVYYSKDIPHSAFEEEKFKMILVVSF